MKQDKLIYEGVALEFHSTNLFPIFFIFYCAISFICRFNLFFLYSLTFQNKILRKDGKKSLSTE